MDGKFFSINDKAQQQTESVSKTSVKNKLTKMSKKID